VRQRWLSPRALGLHLIMLAWVGGCIALGWWQISRAIDGNTLSFLYAVEWPVFAIAGVVVWWLLLHTAAATPEERAQRRLYEERRRAEAQAAMRRPEEEDAALKAYNDYLAALERSDEAAEEAAIRQEGSR
jgi:DNA-binding transcriptional regulator of glucitol operon